MQILNSGSFVNLDNREKIEQLIFTAQQVAHAAVETEGFVNSDENNRQVALEIWQGAEYVCRDHEEANIKNIFVKNFLDKLRELKGTNETLGASAENAEQKIENGFSAANTDDAIPEFVEQSKPSDEFLGFVAQAGSAGQGSEIINVVAARNDTSDADFQASQNQIGENGGFENVSTTNAETFASATTDDTISIAEDNAFDNSLAAPVLDDAANSNTEIVDEPNQFDSPNEIAANTAVDKSPINVLTLPEKEPYQFDKCTVTATIQLLPADSGARTRKAVLSVRTHDFAPQISVVELQNNGGNAEAFVPALNKAFDEYRSNLPVRVMDKLKKEKSAAKKQSSANKTVAATINKPAAQPASGTTNIVGEAANAIANRETANAPAAGNYTASQVQNVAAADTHAVGAVSPVVPNASNQSTATKPAPNASSKKTNSQSSKPQNSLQGSLFGF